jgi:DNA-binding CsgD family transcriptional regulator
MEARDKRLQLTMLSSRDSEILLRSGAAPGRLGVPTGTPLFLASSRPRAELREEADARRPRDDADACAEATAEFLRQPMLMIDAERRIRLRNASGAELLASGDLLVDNQGTLACRDRDSERRLDIAMGTLRKIASSPDIAFARERCAIWLRRRDGGGAAATFHLLHDGGGGEVRKARVLVTVFEPGEPAVVEARIIATAYGLTSAESRLAAMIASGKATAECARELAVKTSTLRSHLSSIYRKTGAKGKTDLVRMVLSLCSI